MQNENTQCVDKENRKEIKLINRILFVFIQCTWGLLQTLIGLVFFIMNRKNSHKVFRGCIDTQWDYYGGLSLGLFIFTPSDKYSNASLIRVHEYGHSIQSLLLGPFMLFVGIVSVLWGNLSYFARLRKRKNLPYTACFVEAWASKWGELTTGEKAIWE